MCTRSPTDLLRAQLCLPFPIRLGNLPQSHLLHQQHDEGEFNTGAYLLRLLENFEERMHVKGLGRSGPAISERHALQSELPSAHPLTQTRPCVLYSNRDAGKRGTLADCSHPEEPKHKRQPNIRTPVSQCGCSPLLSFLDHRLPCSNCIYFPFLSPLHSVCPLSIMTTAVGPFSQLWSSLLLA